MIEKYLGGHGQKWMWPLWSQALKLFVSQEGINGIKWVWVFWQKCGKGKRYFNNFWVVVDKTRCGLLGFVTLTSVVSEEWIDEMSWFFARWYNFRKTKSYVNNYWVNMIKIGQDLMDMELLNWLYLTNGLLIDWLTSACW